MSKQHRLLWLILLVVLDLGVSACSRQEEKKSAGKPSVPVRLAQAEARSVPLRVETFGTVEAQASVAVKSRVTGQLQRVYFREGDEVKQGDLLFTIDPRPFELAVRQGEAALARDRAQQQHARQQAERYRLLLEQKFVSQQEYDQVQSEALAAESLLRLDQAALDSARLQLDYCRIRAPLSGRTGSLRVDPGGLLTANEGDALVVIHQLQPIEVGFTVPEQQLAALQNAMQARKLLVNAAVDDVTSELGELVFVDNSVDRNTGTIRLKGRFANQARRLWPGQFVRLSLTLGTLDNAVVVPSAAVQTGQQGTFVYVVGVERSAEVYPVQTGVTWNGLTVVDGVKAGDAVVVDGQMRLYPGAKVTAAEAGENAGNSNSSTGAEPK